MPLTDYLSDFSEELLYVFVSLIKPNHLTQASRTVGEGLADVISMHESLTNHGVLCATLTAKISTKGIRKNTPSITDEGTKVRYLPNVFSLRTVSSVLLPDIVAPR